MPVKSPGRSAQRQFPSKRTCEKIKQLIRQPTDQDAKTHKEELACFLCAFNIFAPLRDMFLPLGRFFHTFRLFSQGHAKCFRDRYEVQKRC